MSRPSGPHDRAFYLSLEATKRTVEDDDYEEPGRITNLKFGVPDKQKKEYFGVGKAGAYAITPGAEKADLSFGIGCTVQGLWRTLLVSAIGNLAENSSQLTAEMSGWSALGYKLVNSTYKAALMAGGEINKLEMEIPFDEGWITQAIEMMGLYIQPNKDTLLEDALDFDTGFYTGTDLFGAVLSAIDKSPVAPHLVTLYHEKDGGSAFADAFDIQYTGSGDTCIMLISGSRFQTYVNGALDLDLDLRSYPTIKDTSGGLVYAINYDSDYTCTLDGPSTTPSWTLQPQEDVDIKTASTQVKYLNKATANKIRDDCANSIKLTVDRELDNRAGPYTGADTVDYQLANACLAVVGFGVSVGLDLREKSHTWEDYYTDDDDIYLYLDIADTNPVHGVFGPGKVMEPIGGEVGEKELITLTPMIKFYGGKSKAAVLIEA